MDGEAKATRIGSSKFLDDTDEAIERLLALALKPVDPPDGLYERVKRLEQRLERTLEDAAAELSDWELAAMRDPRNWVKPVTALAVGGAAAGALVVLGLRSRRRGPDSGVEAVRTLGDALVDTLGDAIDDVRREVGRSTRRVIK